RVLGGGLRRAGARREPRRRNCARSARALGARAPRLGLCGALDLRRVRRVAARRARRRTRLGCRAARAARPLGPSGRGGSGLDRVWKLRAEGTPAFATIDAGPQVKVLCAPGDARRVAEALRAVPGVERVLACAPGAGAEVVA